MIYVAVIENNNDPLKLARCQVRIFGLHTEDKTIYPTEDLPWAHFLLNSTSISSQGNVFIPNNGDWCIVSFIDPEKQQPIILGTIAKFINSIPDFNIGFNDPNQENPVFINESGLPKIARNEDISSTIIQNKKDNITTGVEAVNAIWDEPASEYASIYPNNKVINTKHHLIELDDTDGKERIHIYHKTGTSTEIHPDGSKVDLIKSNKYMVIDNDNNVLIKGSYNITIDNDKNEQVNGANNILIDGDESKELTGNSQENIGGTKTINSDNDIVTNASNENNIVGLTININGSNQTNITSTGPVNITGNPINLN